MTRIAILGAGPIGVEAALRAAQAGHDVHLFERERVGANVARWGHVRFFSPWRLNRSPWGEARLREAGVPLADDEAYPSGRDYLDQYLVPLAEMAPLAGRVHVGAEVRGVSRAHALKGELIADAERAAAPFLLHVVERSGAERYEQADVVIDTTGVYGQPNPLGPGGLPALGEAAAEPRIERRIPDPLGSQREQYAGKRILLVGAGHSAVTSLRLLEELRGEAPKTRTTWVLRGDASPYQVLGDDPLPQRLALSRFGNDAAGGGVEGVEAVVGGLVRAIAPGDGGALVVTLQVGGGTRVVEVDRIVANVGYRPDLELARELQVHLCWASEGPMKLAASLLAQSGGGGDCLAQTSAGLDVLRSPEPGFWVLGSKSYGRSSQFLLRVGFEQIDEVVGAGL